MVDATANELLHDALVRRQIYLSRFSSGLADDIVRLLDDTEADIRTTLERRLDDIVGRSFGSTTNSRLQVLENAIAKIRQSAFDDASDMWDQNMQDLAAAESDFLNSAMQDVSPVQLDTVLPDPVQLASLVSINPIQGHLLQDWADSLAAADVDRIMAAVKIGVAQGETTPDIVRSVLGSASQDGADGVLELSRRDATSITRTAVSTFSNEARAAWIDANSDIIAQELWVSVLDARTTPECQALDGSVFAVGEGPMPPIHWNCRSVRVPLINGQAIGNRPATTATEDALDGLSREERQATVRELTGQVPAVVNYQDWLDRQTAAFQDDVLGPTRGKLFRNGGLTLDKFVNRNNDTLTLDELRAREPDAFRRAGV